jgi:hypothetical protein
VGECSALELNDHRVQLLLGNRNVRKVLYDRADLDRLVELSRVV